MGCFFLVLSFKSSFHILDNKPLSDITFANIFSRSVDGLLILLIMSCLISLILELMYQFLS